MHAQAFVHAHEFDALINNNTVHTYTPSCMCARARKHTLVQI